MITKPPNLTSGYLIPLLNPMPLPINVRVGDLLFIYTQSITSSCIEKTKSENDAGMLNQNLSSQFFLLPVYHSFFVVI